MTKFLPFILVLIFITSCASPELQNRFIASDEEITENCATIASKVINADLNREAVVLAQDAKKIVYREVDKSEINPSFTNMMQIRAKLKAQYERVVESILDFKPEADLAIKGKAKLLVDPQEAYVSKIMMIRKAKYSLDISYYIFHDDESGRALLHEVRQAIKRGVKVRIRLDSLGSVANAPFYSEVKALSALRGGKIRNLAGELTEERAKAEITIINPLFNIRKHVSNWFARVHNLFVEEGDKLPISNFSFNRRSHDKIIMIDAFSPDDSMAIIGGRNIANYYYALDPDGKTTFQDVEIMIKNIAEVDNKGDVHNALDAYYNKIFYYTANKNLENFLIKINRSGIKKQFTKMREGFQSLFSEGGLGLGKKLKEMENKKYLDNDFEEGMISIVHELQNFSRTKAFLSHH